MAYRVLRSLNAGLIECRRCPRLVEWRERVAEEKRPAFRDDDYWGRPVPGFGDQSAQLLVVGLAPAAHGANRTGRMFTGDRSGDWLYRALYRAGFANQPESESPDDGLHLIDAYITAPVRCAPPANRPTPEERDNCATWFDAELKMLNEVRVIVCLGQYSYGATASALNRIGTPLPNPKPKFGHGVEVGINGGPRMLLSFHPSQQNTFTGKLTEPMFDALFARAKGLTNRR